jgi:hypothetical protein
MAPRTEDRRRPRIQLGPLQGLLGRGEIRELRVAPRDHDLDRRLEREPLAAFGKGTDANLDDKRALFFTVNTRR